MNPIITVSDVGKTYKGGFQALQDINLEVRRGEIFALLGPNGAGKTTLISVICGIVNATKGEVRVDGFNIVPDYREARSRIGLVPQELSTDAFETVWDTVTFSRGLFGLKKNPAHIENVLKSLSLWDKRKSKVMTLSGGMKRRLMIAKALAHEPRILFLDEPTAGVDVELRKDMWRQMSGLRESGVTIILTTHYIEEAEEMADRVGVISGGKLLIVEEKAALMKKMGTKRLILELPAPLEFLPSELKAHGLTISPDNASHLVYAYDSTKGESGIAELLAKLQSAGVKYKDLNTHASSLEDIFFNLVSRT